MIWFVGGNGCGNKNPYGGISVAGEVGAYVGKAGMYAGTPLIIEFGE